MNDKQIRAAAHKKLFRRHSTTNPNVLILEEIGLRNGAARVDFLVVKDSLHGFEIKSDKDTLLRLENQIPIYNSVLDRVTLIVGYRLADKAMKMVPVWWGVKLAYLGKRGGVHFHDARSSKKNPSLEKESVVKLLWHDQALEVLSELGMGTGMLSKSKREIHAMLAQHADLSLIQTKVRHYFRLRASYQSDAKRKPNGD